MLHNQFIRFVLPSRENKTGDNSPIEAGECVEKLCLYSRRNRRRGLSGRCRAAHAQLDYPNRPIELIVTFGPGGGADLMGRKMAQLLEPELGVSIPVTNVAGASGNAGLTRPSTSEPDGHTMGTLISLTVASMSASPSGSSDGA